ncbi:hypothetical protein QUA81_09875 [Microcoleus sp. F6_B4]
MLATVALLSPLALVPEYRVEHPSLLRMAQIYGIFGKTQPPGSESLPIGRSSLPKNSR